MRVVCLRVREDLSPICWSLSKSLTDSKLRVTWQVGSLRTGIFTLAVPSIEEEQADRTSMWHSLSHGHRNWFPQDDTHGIVRFAELPHGPCAERQEDHCFGDEPAKVSLSVNLHLGNGVSDDGKIISFAVWQVDEHIGKAFIRLALAIQMYRLVIEFFELRARNWLEIHLYFLLLFLYLLIIN